MATNYPGALDSYSTKTAGDTIAEGHINDPQDAIEALEAKVGTGVGSPSASSLLAGTATGTATWATTVTVTALSTTGTIVSAGDMFTVPLTNYFASSTIVGWAASPIGTIYTKKIGKTVFVLFHIEGTSNGNNATFTLPYTNGAIRGDSVLSVCLDNSANQCATVQSVYLAVSSVTVVVSLNGNSAGWTASGNKLILGQFFYEAA